MAWQRVTSADDAGRWFPRLPRCKATGRREAAAGVIDRYEIDSDVVDPRPACAGD
jgi:hypothetical protein